MENSIENTETQYLRSQIAALEQLLVAHEKTALEQTDKLYGEISERKRIEEARKDNEQFLQTLMDSIPAPIFYKNTDGKYMGCNKAFEDFLGMQKEEIIGKTVYEVAPKELAACYYEADLALFRNRGSQVYEARVKPSNSSVRDVVFHKAVFYGHEREIAGLIGIILDITDRKRVEESLRKSEASLANAQRIAHLGNWEWNIVTNELRWSDEVCRIFGLAPLEFGATYEAFLNSVHPDDREFVKESVNKALYEKIPYSINHRIILPDGSERIVHEQAEVIFGDTGEPIQMNGIVQDITELKRTEEALMRRIDTEKAVAGISARLVKFTDFNKAIDVSLADIGRLSGACRVCLFQFCDNGSIMDNTHEWCDEGVIPEIKNLQTAMFPWWMKNLHADNVIYITDVSKMPLEASIEKEFLERQGIKSLLAFPLYIEEKLLGFIRLDNLTTIAAWQEEDVSLVRITSEIIGNAIARKQTEALINYLAYYDTLTNLPNRNLLQDRLQIAMTQAKRTGCIVAIMVLDLDGFKTINDSLGHPVGDLLLKAVAERLTRCIRKGDTIARLGGDEFMVILHDLDHALNAATVANKIIHALQQPFFLNEHKLHTTASIGISIYPLDSDNKDSLIKQADIAMYLSKEHGKDTFRFYNANMNTCI
ncbi:MAG: sensor domain-containing diguanylate cyclase [Candidatus Brocadia sp.]|nr:sensor domain-containing diguanylate cyclase [Candidatus Brocadia sp.]